MKNKKKILSALAMCATAAVMGLGVIGCNKKTDQGGTPGDGSEPTPVKQTAFTNKTPESEAKIIYIGTPAAGTTGDGKSASTPYGVYEFFEKHYEELTPGTHVKVTPGEHTVLATCRIPLERSGTYDDYIIFEPSDPTQKTVLNFKQQKFNSTARGVQIDGNFFYWKGIDICGAGDNGLYIGGSYNIVEDCEFYNNRDTGLQLGRSFAEYTNIKNWPSYNLIKNCTSYNNYDNQTYGENADGFAAKLTVGYGNVFDGCIAYRNSDDGWDLYGKPDSGNIGAVMIYNCVAFENGFLMDTQKNCNDWFGSSYNTEADEPNTNSYTTRDGDGNGFKLGGSTMTGDVIVKNCMSFGNRMHGVTDNSNPGVISLDGVTSYNNAAGIDRRSHLNIIDENGKTNAQMYFSIRSDGYIMAPSNRLVVVDSATKQAIPEYVNLDKDGYIIDGDSTRILDENKNPIKGENIKAQATGQTPNPAFGHIDPTVAKYDTDQCNNIDIARTDGSYNNLKNVLSVNNESKSLGHDMYRGSAENCLLAAGDKMHKITDRIDASSYIDKKAGAEVANVVASDVFEKLPTYNFGISKDIDSTYRNDDNSINMGAILKVKDYSKLLGNDKKVGCDLTKSSWDEYEHFDYIYMTDEGYVKDDVSARRTAVYEMLYLPTSLEACYQNFKVITTMLDCTITWTSSDESILKVGTEEGTSVSAHKDIEIDVTRPVDSDKVVTLTAKIEDENGKYFKKTFDVNVKKITYEVGDILVEGINDGSVIMAQFDAKGEPKIQVTNAADYAGKLLPENAYTVTSQYWFGADKNAQKVERRTFNTGTAGVWTIEKTVSIGEDTQSYKFNVFVVSPAGDIDFAKNVSNVTVTHSGFNIGGELTNVSGSLYAMVSATAPTAEQIKANGIKKEIVWDQINFEFEYNNAAAYDIYYILCNPNGDIKSQVYKKSVEIVNIGTPDEFAKLISSGSDSSKIYRLTADLDFAGKTWKAGDKPFTGLLDGNGHTIKNIEVAGNAQSEKGAASIFYRLDGGTIMNVNFDNIKLEGGQDVGVIGQAYSGYVANIKMTNIRCMGEQRIGGLIGHVYEQTNNVPLIIDKISLINTSTEAVIQGSSQRAGGIVGFIQTNSTSGLKSNIVDVRISNCYVDAHIGSDNSQQNGGIVGCYDTESQQLYVTYSLSVTQCYFNGVARASSRCGGIVAYYKGLQKLYVYGCINLGEVYHAGAVEPLVTPEKNCSGIMGGYSSQGDCRVVWCYALLSEHNSNYDVTLIEDMEYMKSESVWSSDMHFDLEKVWQFDANSDTIVTLR